MTEHEVCIECKWNKYPVCIGSLWDGIPMTITDLADCFQCGQKEKDVPYNQLPFQSPTKIFTDKIEELEARLKLLEKEVRK